VQIPDKGQIENMTDMKEHSRKWDSFLFPYSNQLVSYVSEIQPCVFPFSAFKHIFVITREREFIPE